MTVHQKQQDYQILAIHVASTAYYIAEFLVATNMMISYLLQEG